MNDEIAWHCCKVSVVVTACIRSGCVVEDVVVRVVAFLLLLLLQEGLVLLVQSKPKVRLPSIPNHRVDVLAAVVVDTRCILVQRYIAVVFAFQKVRLLLLSINYLLYFYLSGTFIGSTQLKRPTFAISMPMHNARKVQRAVDIKIP